MLWGLTSFPVRSKMFNMNNQANNTQKKKSIRVSQAEMPRATLIDVVKLAEALRDNFAGKDATPIDLAKSLNRSPGSSTWRFLTGAAVAYGLTDAAYGADSISLTALGRQVVSPTEEGFGQQGLTSALLKPAVLKNFYEKYDKARFPQNDIAKNVLNQLGVPQERTDEALRIVVKNAEYVGIMTQVGGNQYIQLDSAKKLKAPAEKPLSSEEGVPPHPDTSKDFEMTKLSGTKLKIEMPAELKEKILNESETATGWHNAIAPLITFGKKEVPEIEEDKKEPPVGDTEGG